MSNLELKVEKKVDEEVVDGLVKDEEVTEKQIEESLNYDALSKEEKEAIEEFNSKIDINDATQILQYGVATQEKISKFSDSILEDVKTKNAGDVGELVNLALWGPFSKHMAICKRVSYFPDPESPLLTGAKIGCLKIYVTLFLVIANIGESFKCMATGK